MISSNRLIWYAIAALFLLLAQLNLGFISVENVVPDLLVIYVVVVALLEGQFTGIIAGFLVGVAYDWISSDIDGTNALSKLFAGFIAGFFYEEGLEVQGSIGTFRFLGITAGATLAHNIIYYFFYVQPADLSFWNFFLRGGLAGVLYTTVVAAIVMLVAARKKSW
ncbi:MAG: rod shape-determining protein MreD [Ignavibacteriae bacterium]|nr:rod shape-determining protein MreD [Ignavibacteriota bacterium]MCB9215926.1 rod shape-determining protein MreD [Ignavibacteria bacterium]